MLLFTKFAAVGAIGTLLHYCVLFAFVRLGYLPPELAAMLGAAAGAIANYFLNRRFSFQTDRNHLQAAPLFVALVIFGIFANGAIIKIGTLIGINYMIAQLFATAILLCLNFLICKSWIFTKTN